MTIWNMPSEHADVVVIGGGLTGCSIAYHLAARGIQTCLLEGSHLGAGASSANDGQIILETADYYHRMKEVYGPREAFQILDFKRQGQRGMHMFLEPMTTNVGLAYHQNGSLTLAINDTEARTIELATEAMIADGFEVEPVDRRAIESMIQTSWFPSGKLDRFDATVNPAELTRTIASEARKLGAVIIEGCRVEHVEPGKIKHQHGQTTCEIAIVATNAYTAGILPDFRELVFPIRGQVLSTQPCQAKIPPYACITNFGYDYWHWTTDGRLILGGRRFVDEHGETGLEQFINPKVQAALEALFHEIYPQFAELPVHHRWSGIMGFSRDGKPLIGPLGGDPRLWCAVGFTGYGLGLCWSVGLSVAQVLNGEDTELTRTLAIFSPSRFA